MSRVVAVIAVIAGDLAGIWKIALPTSIRLVWPAIQASIVAASEPYASEAQTHEYPSRSASCASARWSAGVVQAVWYPRLSDNRIRCSFRRADKPAQGSRQGPAGCSRAPGTRR